MHQIALITMSKIQCKVVYTGEKALYSINYSTNKFLELSKGEGSVTIEWMTDKYLDISWTKWNEPASWKQAPKIVDYVNFLQMVLK